VVEARAEKHYQGLSADERDQIDDEITALLSEATEESAEHRRQLESLIDELDADTILFEHIQMLVTEQYDETKPDDFDGLLYDQLYSEESAYKFYDDLITGIKHSDTEFGVSNERLLETLEAIREEEAEGVERVTQLMRTR
jgi:rubrerythrin